MKHRYILQRNFQDTISRIIMVQVIVLGFLTLPVFGQQIKLNSGAYFKTTGATIIVNGKVDNAGSLTNSGTTGLIVSGDFQNSGTFVSGTAEHKIGGNWTNNGTFTGGSGTVTFNGSLPQTISGTNTFNNLTVFNTSGVAAAADLSVNGILYLQSANANSTRGCLDMSTYTLTMGTNATTTGIGDVTGIIKRTTISHGVVYSFGNQYTTIYFPNTGTLPGQMSMKISIGTAPAWRTGAINREIEIIQTGGSGTIAEFSYRYLDSELNGNAESRLVIWDKLNNAEFGRSNFNNTNNWVSMSNFDIDFFSSSWDGTKNLTLDENSTASTLTWNGSINDSWTTPGNWTPNALPSMDKNIIIPDAVSTSHDPLLPAATEIKTLSIETGGILNSGTGTQLTINGSSSAWSNDAGTFNPATGNVIFTNSLATLSGSTDFYNVAINSGAVLWMMYESTMRIAGTVTNNGTWHTDINGATTVEYNGGAQTVVLPNSASNRYYHLILSGNGIKTMPSAALGISGNFSMSGTASATAAAAITITGNFSIGSGNSFTTGAFGHFIGGNFSNSNIFTATGSTITMNGTSVQTIGGTATSTFDNLIINNGSGVSLLTSVNINNALTLTSGNFSIGANTLGIYGALTSTAGILTGGSTSNIIIGGSGASTSLPGITLNNLTLNRSNGIGSGGTINIGGTLALTAGTLTLGADTLTISGNSPTRTSGNINANNVNATLAFTNTNAITLPASIFTGNVNNLFLNGAGGVVLGSATTVSGRLTLTNGILTTTSSNTLTIANTSVAGITGGGTTSFIKGPVTRNLPASLNPGFTYFFPVGKDMTFLPMSVVDPVTGTGTITLTGEAFAVSSGGSADGTTLTSISTSEYWSLASAGNFTNSKISLTRQTAVLMYAVIGRSTAVAGIYSSVGGTPGDSSINNSNPTGGGAIQFFVMAQKLVRFTVSGSTNADGTYTSLTNALGVFAAINATAQTGNTIVITVDGNSTAEAGTNSLNAGAWTSLTMYPTVTGLTISGSVAGPMINLNGADNVTIDGRLNAEGSSKDLVITNTNTGSVSATSTIRFINSAENNTVKYCTIKGAEATTLSGILFFSTATAGNGNDGNTIMNNNITSDAAGRPVNALFSYGSSGFENSGNTILDNTVFDFLKYGTASSGINLSSYSTSWTILGNSFYETTSFIPASSVGYNIILVNNNSGTGFTVSGNYLGGNAASCAGTWTKSAAYDNVFYAINLNVGTTTASSIQNNTIQNFAWSNSAAAAWTGIQVTVGNVNIGTVAGNTIGAATGNGSITVTGGANGTNVYGINVAGSGTVVCQNNTIGSITAANANEAYSSNVYAINRINTGITTISNNMIGSPETSNSILASSGSTSNPQIVAGINNTTGGTISLNNNIINNLTNGTTNADAATQGLINGIASTYGANTLTNNTISNLSIANANNSATHTASVCGITVTCTNALNTITSNTIFNLSNTHPSFGGNVIGLYFGSTGMYTSVSHTVTSNFIHSLAVTGAASNTAALYGIKIFAGQTTYANNIISLGGNTTTTIYGIYETGTANNNNNLYFNTVYVFGEPATGALNSYALYSAVSTNTRNFRDNIFENARSNSGSTGKHYAAYFGYAAGTSLTLDFNNYYSPGTGGMLGYFNGTDVSTLPLIAGMDVNSLAINPGFVNAGGTLAADYVPSSVKLAGTTISVVPTDYALTNRAGTPTMGAFEGNLSLNIDVFISGNFESSYLRLKDAFDKINFGTHTGAIELRIKGNTTETASAVLYQSGYTGTGGNSSYSSVTIYPTEPGITISGNLDSPLIDLNGADNVTIDGRLYQWSERELIITNTSTGTIASTIRFVNSAENNLVKFCTIKGSETNGAGGIILFSSSSAGNGNDNNTIDNNRITSDAAGRPNNAIYSSGTTGRDNSANIISANNIFDFLRPNASSNGIYIGSSSIDWEISDNSFFETSPFFPTSGYTYYAIFIGTTANHMVSGNYIGGRNALCTGLPWTVNSNYAHYFCGISISGGASIATIVENNIIQNISYTSTQNNPWDGIYIAVGNVDVTGNTIGATEGTGSITVTCPIASATATISGGVVTAINLNGGGSNYTTAPLVTFSASGSTTPATATAYLTGGVVTSIVLNSGGSGYTSVPSVIFDGQSNGYSTSHGMIKQSSGTVTITANNIGSITTVGSGTYSHGFESIYVRGVTGALTISNNLIGSLTEPNSIYTSSTASSSLQKQDVYGIYSSGTGTTVISGNTVANLTNGYTGTNSASRARGISTIAGSNTIQNNIVRNISTASAQNSAAASASVIGVSQSSATAGTLQVVSDNTIYNLSNTNASAAVVVSGIYYAGPTTGVQTISANFIHGLSSSSSNTGCEMDGIVLNMGLTTCANNIISLGTGITTGYKIYGLWDESGSSNNNKIYFNSVYLGGTVSGTTSSTAALWNKANTSTRNYRNNILLNARSGGTTGKHYAIYLAGTAGLTIDYNDYYVSGSGGMLGRIGLYDKADLTAWKAGTSQDVHSLSINPGFTLAGGTLAFNYYTSEALPGVSGTGITKDYSGLIRGETPKMGALEDNNFTWQGSLSTDFGTPANWTGGVVPTFGANIMFADNPSNHCILDQNRTVGNITNAQATDKLVVNGFQLTITDSLKFTNNAKIDASSSSSVVSFNGSVAQSIPSEAFVSNIIAALSINNTSGVTLIGDLTIPATLMLTDGIFSLGANTLTLNGAIVTTNGNLNGDGSANIIIGGIGASTNLPSVVLNDLTLNRSNGIGLGGDVIVGGTLTLTAGTLNVGANKLTISDTLTRTSGTINASNAAATLAFTNDIAIILTASIFTGNVNNLTIDGTGGITSGFDFTINGVLDLHSENPSVIKGSLDMWDGSDLRTLTMGANATTTGAGDVTGIVKRTSFAVNTDYSFGNQFTTLDLAPGGILPSSVSIKIVLTSSNIYWKTDAIHRYYDIIQTGGNNLTRGTLTLHYLDGELNGATEGSLDLFDYHVSGNHDIDDHGHSNDNSNDNWVSLANLRLTYIAPATDFPSKYWTLGNSNTANFTWLGASDGDWNNGDNWVGGMVPATGNHAIIPDKNTTAHDPDLPGSATIGSIRIQPGGLLNGATGTTLTIDGGAGAWDNMGTFNAGTSTVVFTNAAATMANATSFYNVTVSDGAKLTLGIDNLMGIAGTLSLSASGILNAALNHNTVEFNGTDQSIVNPNGASPGYHNLSLTGSGTKTMPGTALSVIGDFSVSGTASAIAGAAITFGGNVTIEGGAAFTTGAFLHSITGNFENNGTFTATSGNTIAMNGTSAQSMGGTTATTFDNLTINNGNGVTLFINENVNNILTLSRGDLNIGASTFEINGTISRTSGFLYVSSQSSLNFGGTAAFTLPDDLFATSPSLNNLTIDRSGGITLGNQSMTVNGLLDLPSGIFSLGANTLTITGSSPVRTSGTIGASGPGATLVFANSTAIILPPSIFSGNVNNLTLNGTGGITASSDFTIAGVLYLQSVNPSATKGSLDMWDGSEMKILSMETDAITLGLGDVTGIVSRTSPFVENTPYTFGNQFNIITLASGGTYPTQFQVKTTIGTSPSWKPGAIQRINDIIRTGGSGCFVAITSHYLDEELNGNNEELMVRWKFTPPSTVAEVGRTDNSTTENWIANSNIGIANLPTTFGSERTSANSELVALVWNGSVDSDWVTMENWTPRSSPTNLSNILIPDASTTPNEPTLPASAEIRTLTIDAGGIINSAASPELTINGSIGAWINNGGTFNPGTGTVIFTGALATISGVNNFYNVTINSGADLRMGDFATMRIGGTMANNGVWHAVVGEPTTVEYNGAVQTVAVPNPSTNRYYNLILSGSGTKTMPATALSVNGDFSMSGTATTTAIAVLTIGGNFTIGSGTAFTTGALSHTIGGNFSNNGTFTATGSTITCIGTSAQTIGGTAATSFNNLTSNNATGVTVTSDALTTVSGALTINSGKKLKVAPGKQLTSSGTITNSAGNTGFVLQSDAAGTASLLHNTTNVPATVQRYISGDAEAWHFISSPVAAQAITGSWLPSGTYGNGTGYDMYVWNEHSNCWIYQLNTTSDTNWGTVHPGSDFVAGRGYLYSVQATNPTKEFAGNLNNGTVSYALSYSSASVSLKGFNLVGNPYPSSADWHASSGWTRSNLASTGGGYNMWIWNPAAHNYGVYNSADADGVGTNSVTRYIASMQGYFVQAASEGDLVVNNNVRVHGDGNWFKNREQQPRTVSFNVVSDAGYGSDEIQLGFGYDKNENGAVKLFSKVPSAPSLFMPSGSEYCSVRYLTDTIENPMVPAMFRSGRDGNYTLTCNFDDSEFEVVMLEDRQTHYFQDMKRENTYGFKSSTGDDMSRFYMHFGPDNNATYNDLPAGLYTDGIQLIIDLTLVGKETEVRVCDLLGRILVQKTLQGLTKHKLSINAKSQILIVYLKNQQGYLCRKLYYN